MTAGGPVPEQALPATTSATPPHTEDSVDYTPLDPRSAVLFYLQAFSRLVLFWIPASVVLGTIIAILADPLTGVIVGFSWLFLMFLAALWIPLLAYYRWGYVLREEDLLIRRGVIVRSVTAIPTARIQHVDTRQGPIEQWMGLARLQIHTASGVGSDGVIPGLTVADAEALRDVLVEVEGDCGV